MSSDQFKAILFCAAGFLGAQIFVWLGFMFVMWIMGRL